MRPGFCAVAERLLFLAASYKHAPVEIDDTKLSLREFGELLLTREGWGMRLVFVPEHELHRTPRVRVRPGKREDRS